MTEQTINDHGLVILRDQNGRFYLQTVDGYPFPSTYADRTSALRAAQNLINGEELPQMKFYNDYLDPGEIEQW